MSWPTLADMALKAAIGAFKTQVTYTRAADPGNPISLAGVYDEVNQAVDPQTGVIVDSKTPTLGVRLADLPADPDAGDQVAFGGKTFEVLDNQEDGQGGSKLTLRRLT